MKLNSEQAKAAWELYCKGFAIDSSKIENIASIEYAFKHAFALGQETQKEVEPTLEPKPTGFVLIEEPSQLDLFADAARKGISKVSEVVSGKITRTYNGRVRRTHAQRQREAALVAQILRTKGKEMYLQDIRHAVNANGCNWKEQSVTGYINDAMEYYPQIKKVGHGIYEYKE